MRLPIAAACCGSLLLAMAGREVQPVWGSPTSTTAHVMVVGTFHFVRGQSDMYRVNAGDVLAPKRQREIADVVALLSKYEPTEIAVEAPVGGVELQKRFQDYRAGTYTLTADETDQIGFRLAKQLGRQQIYGIDSKMDLDFDRVMQFAQAQGQTAALQKVMDAGEAFTKELDADLAKSSIGDVLRKMNSAAELRRNHELYMGMALIGQNSDYPGADVVGQWYTRNLRIYSNIRRVINSPDERVLVLFGQGHEFLLQQYIVDSGDLVLDQFNDLK